MIDRQLTKQLLSWANVAKTYLAAKHFRQNTTKVAGHAEIPIPLTYILNIFNQFSLRFFSLARYLQGRTASSGGEARLDAGHPNELIVTL